MKRRNIWLRDDGFTIMEMIVAIAVAATVMGIAVPTFFSWLPTLRLSSAARQVATDLQVARMKAISQNTKFRLNFVTTTTYTVEKDNSGTLTTEGGPYSLPDGVSVPVGTTSWFQPRGTADSQAAVALSNGSTQKVVCIKPVGRVNIVESSCT